MKKRIISILLCLSCVLSLTGCTKARTEKEQAVDEALAIVNDCDFSKMYSLFGYGYHFSPEHFLAVSPTDWDWLTFEMLGLDYCDNCHTIDKVYEDDGYLYGDCKCGRIKEDMIMRTYQHTFEISVVKHVELHVPVGATLKVEDIAVPLEDYHRGYLQYTGYVFKSPIPKHYEVTLSSGEKRIGTFTASNIIEKEGYNNGYYMELGFDN